MLLLAKVPQTGQFVSSCLAPKHLASPSLGYCQREPTYRELFFPNWKEDDMYVLKLCLRLARMVGILFNQVLAQSCVFSPVLQLLIVSYCLYSYPVVCSLVLLSLLPRHGIPPADSGKSTEFGENSISSLCHDWCIHPFLCGCQQVLILLFSFDTTASVALFVVQSGATEAASLCQSGGWRLCCYVTPRSCLAATAGLYKLITVNCVPPLHNQLMWLRPVRCAPEGGVRVCVRMCGFV